MPNAWKWKVGLLAGLALLSVYLLVPTFLGFQTIRDEATVSGHALPWYFSLLPDKGINLGLDLRGGIYLEFDVELDRAIENRIDLIADELSRSFHEAGIAVEGVKQDAKTHTISITAKDGAAIEQASSYIAGHYRDVLVEQSHGNNPQPNLIAAFNDRYANYLKDQITKQALEKVRNRIDRYGVAEPSIQLLGSKRIAVELPGVKDPERAIGLIKKAGQLEFKLVSEGKTAAELAELIATGRKELALATDDFSTAIASALTEHLAAKLPADTEIAFETKFDAIAKKITGGIPYLLSRKAELTGEMLKDAQVNFHNNEPYVSLTFDARGTELFGTATSKNVGRRLAIVLDGVVNSSPVIREPILGGQAQITLGYGSYNELRKECEDLVLVLQEGALPAQLTEATKTIVGPSLGADSIHQGIVATFVATGIVIIFMLLYYHLSGILANLALGANLLFILAALSLFQATLTLPGIAGIALTIGMAVDTNILIFERMREEIRSGKVVRAVVDAGYSNAMRAIIDSHITTILAGVVLYQFGSGPIRGFAVTLIIGLLINLYSACICTRLAYDWFLIKRRITRISV